MTFEEYTETYAIEWLDGYFQHKHWDGGLNTHQCFELIIEMSNRAGIEIIDIDTCDYDRYLFNWYNSIERGLS